MVAAPGDILLEIIAAVSDREGIFILLPAEVGEEKLQDAFWLEPWQPHEHPHNTVKHYLKHRLQTEPVILHSTSWRVVPDHQHSAVVLTYLAVMPVWLRTKPGLIALPFDDALGPIAKGGSTTPPPRIKAWQVARHAFEHLHHLSRTDEAIRCHLSDFWKDHLKSYTFSLFRGE